jgi:hypothetical protein
LTWRDDDAGPASGPARPAGRCPQRHDGADAPGGGDHRDIGLELPTGVAGGPGRPSAPSVLVQQGRLDAHGDFGVERAQDRAAVAQDGTAAGNPVYDDAVLRDRALRGRQPVTVTM